MHNGKGPVSEPRAWSSPDRAAGPDDRAHAFARAALALAGDMSPGRAKALGYAARRLAAFGRSVGLPPEPSALLCPAVIERFLLCGTDGLSAASRRTLASNLRALARAAHGESSPRRLRLPRERAKAPYGGAEIEAFLACAKAQSTPSRRMRCQALVCLGAGAGVIGQELRHLKGSDVTQRSGGVIVAVSGKRARVVPVRPRFQGPLLESADFAGPGLLIGGWDPERGNLTDAIHRLFADPALPALEAGRLRSTWLTEAARQIGLQAFMAAAGLRCSQRLGDIASTLPESSERELVALLEGQA